MFTALRRGVIVSAIILPALAAPALGQPRLSDYFGFGDLEVVKLDRGAGPITTADVNGDGLNDLIAINNFKSRVEIHYQRPNASPDNVDLTDLSVNETPSHWRFRRENLSVSLRATGVVAHDYTGDGRRDIIIAGQPGELVFMAQQAGGGFKLDRRRRVKGLQAGRNSFAVHDLIGDARPELAAIVGGEIQLWTFRADGALEPPVTLSAGGDLVGFSIEDFNGDGGLDIMGVIPENPAPLRLWLSEFERGERILGPQVRFEAPALREFDAVRLPDRPAALVAIIERNSKRVVFSELTSEPVASSGVRDAAMVVHSFTDDAGRSRKVVVADVDGDGRQDLVATDTESNSVVVYRQAPQRGFQPGDPHPSLSDLEYLAAADVDGDKAAEVFVLSEKEGVVGRSDPNNGGLPFPRPIAVADGHTPVSMNLVTLEGAPHLAVVAKDGRDHIIELISMENHRHTVDLGSQSRSPETIIDLDADQDGRVDLLLFTRDKPMMMLHAGADGVFTLTESDDMGQFGLVKAAEADNTAVFDIDGDGKPELLIADKNYVRAVRYQPNPGSGVAQGWQVVAQINAVDPAADLISLTVLNNQILAADKENNRILIMAQKGDEWRETDAINVRGFDMRSITAGRFSGDNRDNVLAIGDDGFAVIHLSGERLALDEVAAWRTDREARLQHEFAVGDVNGDGFTDVVTLDAGEQMCEIFTFSEAERLLYAMSFEVFESKIFSGGEARTFEPSEAYIVDITGDGAQDLIMLSHDRVLIYPQQVNVDE